MVGAAHHSYLVDEMDDKGQSRLASVSVMRRKENQAKQQTKTAG